MKKILVVDDNEGILEAMEVMLEGAGYTVETSCDGEVLEGLTKENSPDLILLDVLLSGKDGRELCKTLKGKDETKHIPIIMLSAHPKAADDVKKCGANGFISKPFDISVLLEKVSECLDSPMKK